MREHPEEDTFLKLPKGPLQPMTNLRFGSPLIDAAVVETIEKWLANLNQETRRENGTLVSSLAGLRGDRLTPADLSRAESEIRNLLAFCELSELNNEILSLQYDALISLTCIYLLRKQKAQARVIVARARDLATRHPALTLSSEIKAELERLSSETVQLS